MRFRIGGLERMALRIREIIERNSEHTELHFSINSRAEYLRAVELLEEKWDRQDQELSDLLEQDRIAQLLQNKPRAVA